MATGFRFFAAGKTLIIDTNPDNNTAPKRLNLSPSNCSTSLDFDAPSGYAFTRRDAGSNDAINSDVEPQNFLNTQKFVSPNLINQCLYIIVAKTLIIVI
jgi:hypothetical protein